MLPPANRLRKEKDIKRVLGGRKSCRAGLLACKTASSGPDARRFCFIVSNRVSNRAVVRNRLKRRLREAVRARLSRVRPGVDCVLIALPGAQDKTFAELETMVENVLRRAGILEEHKT